MKRMITALLILAACSLSRGENYLINGGQESRIHYSLVQEFRPVTGTKKVSLSFVIPQNFKSPTYNQKINNFHLTFTPEPATKETIIDKRGNKIITAGWIQPESTISVTTSFNTVTETKLDKLESSAPFPPLNIPEDSKDYLMPTKLVQSDSPLISTKAHELVKGVKSQFDAVQRILSWIVDNMHYVTPPEKYDALYSFKNKKGNCQNYSHLAAAMMRSIGIPVRIVNGVTLKEPYSVKTESGSFTFKMGQGRHSWIEVLFPDLGWIPFDPQQTELFVSNRFIRIEIGIDNKETINDGLVRWIQSKGINRRPKYIESIEASFVADSVKLAMSKQNYGPKNMLLCPKIEAVFKPVIIPPVIKPRPVKPPVLKKLQYDKPTLFGNTQFPRNIDFSQTRTREEEGKEEFILKRNFIVESAEYVTTKLTQYAQIFIVDKPLKLVKAGIALHKFGGSGQVWLELFEDNNNKPGRLISASKIKDLGSIKTPKGYDWIDFDFSGEKPLLSPGQYWISLAFTGSPIINWFYTYSKTAGPVYGTRYKSVYDSDWSNALSYEFNFRIVGWSVR